MSLNQLATKQAVMTAYCQSHDLAGSDKLPAIASTLRRTAQKAAAKLPAGLHSDKFSKSLDREVNNQLAIESHNHVYTQFEANAGVFAFLTDLTLTRNVVEETYGISQRTITRRVKDLLELPQYRTIAEDTHSFRRLLSGDPGMHDALREAIEQGAPTHGRPRYLSALTSDLVALHADKLSAIGNGQDRRTMKSAVSEMFIAHADYMDEETGGEPTPQSKMMRAAKVSRSFMESNFSGSREETLTGMNTNGNKIHKQ